MVEKTNIFKLQILHFRNTKSPKKKMRLKNVIIPALFLICLMSLVSSADNSTYLTGIGDTYVAKNTPVVNYNYSSVLDVQNHGSQARRIYTKWCLSCFANQTLVNVTFAQMCLYMHTDGATSNVSIYRVFNTSWLAGVITWDNQVCGVDFNETSQCNLSIADRQTTTGVNNYFCWNVTTQVRSAVDNNLSAVAFVLKTPEDASNGLDSFYSSRYAGAQKPYLFVNYTYFCSENWVLNYSACNISNQRVKKYYDNNGCGTNTTLPADNGTIEYCDYCVQTWYCAEFDNSCGSGVPELNCLNVSYENVSCCSATGLPSDCDYLTLGNYSDYDLYCGDIDVTLLVPTYPYVDFNTSYPMALIVTQNNITFNLSEFKINLTEPSGNTSVFNWTWDAVDERYEINFIFTEVGDYPFRIYAEYPYDNIPSIYGTLIVRVPCYITFEGYETKNQAIKPYDNDFAYIIAEKTDKMYYDNILESFIVPLLFSRAYNTSVFHAPYIDGSATLKIWDNQTNYAVRLIDGQISFDGQYSVPNVSDGYGANIYLGRFYWNCSQNETIRVYLDERDINQYRWLFNWIFVIGLVLIIATSIFMFFVIPEYSQLSIIFGLGFTLMLVAFRIFFFIWRGW